MWALVAVVGWALVLGGVAAGSELYPPLGTVPDHVITGRRDSEDTNFTIRRHGTRERADYERRESRFTRYTDYERQTTLTIHQLERGLRVSQATGNWSVFAEARRTGRRDYLLGEDCYVWQLAGPRPNGRARLGAYLSCVTDDGIRLWEGHEGAKRSFDALSVERRDVSSDEVRRPREFLETFRALVEANRGPPGEAPGVLVELEASPDAPRGDWTLVRRRIVRRDAWTVTEEVRGEGTRSVLIRHASGVYAQLLYPSAGGLMLNLLHDPEGLLTRAMPHLAPTDRTALILGEECRWFEWVNEHAVLPQAFERECRTSDGGVLAAERQVRIPDFNLTARHLERRLVALSEILPEWILQAQTWGLPD